MSTSEAGKRPHRVVAVGRAAKMLGKKPSNVSKFLDSYGIRHFAEQVLPGGDITRLWLEADVERAGQEYIEHGGGPGGPDADEKRRVAARARQHV